MTRTSTKADHCAWSCPSLTDGVGRTCSCSPALARFTAFCPANRRIHRDTDCEFTYLRVRALGPGLLVGRRLRRAWPRGREILRWRATCGRPPMHLRRRLDGRPLPDQCFAAAARFELRLRRRGQLRLRRAVDVRRRSLAAGVRVAERLRVRRLLNRDASRGATLPTHRIRDFSPPRPCAFALLGDASSSSTPFSSLISSSKNFTLRLTLS